MAKILVECERDNGRGWLYEVTVTPDVGPSSRHEVSLAWVDHEYWSGGARAPSRVIEALIESMLDRVPPTDWCEIPQRFDASTARRWWPGIDAEVRRRL